MTARPPASPAPALPDLDAVTVRRAGVADAAALADFAAAAFRATYGPTGDPTCGGGSRAEDVAAYVDGHFAPAIQAAELADASLHTLLAEGPGGIAGYAQLRLPPAGRAGAPPAAGERPAELARFYVGTPWQGRGVAGELVAAVFDAAAAAGADAVWLCAYQRNARAVAFYRRHGFRIVGAATFRMGDEVQHDHLMVR